MNRMSAVLASCWRGKGAGLELQLILEGSSHDTFMLGRRKRTETELMESHKITVNAMCRALCLTKYLFNMCKCSLSLALL